MSTYELRRGAELLAEYDAPSEAAAERWAAEDGYTVESVTVPRSLAEPTVLEVTAEGPSLVGGFLGGLLLALLIVSVPLAVALL